MNPERTKQHASCPGFTLIELMMVVAIIAVLASLTIGGLRYYDEKTKYSRTEVLIKSIESALEEYKRDNGAYPTGADTTVVFTALYGAGTNVYLSTLNPD
ncbi:MAG: type II secretion system protein, partial [Akkermansiaceae bacterium]